LESIKKYVELLGEVSEGINPCGRFSENNTLGSEEGNNVALMLRRLSDDDLIYLDEGKIVVAH